MPISAQAKADMRRLQDPQQPDYMPGLTSAEKKARLATMSLEDWCDLVREWRERTYSTETTAARGQTATIE
jgi:hypothetical protein